MEKSYQVQCPICEERPVTVAKQFWKVRGALIVVIYGSETHIGCTQCVNGKGWQNFGFTLFLGWWSFLGFVFTPFALLQNLISICTSPDFCRSQTERLLREAGLNPENLLVFESEGNEDRNYLPALVQLLHRGVWADGSYAHEEGTTVIQVLSRMGAKFDADSVISRMKKQPSDDEIPDFSGTDLDFRLFAFRVLLEIISADGQITASELTFMRKAGAGLSLPSELVEHVLVSLKSPKVGLDQEVSWALNVFGLSEVPEAVDLKQRYRQLVLKHHPDRHMEAEDKIEAEEQTKAINRAYTILLATVSRVATPA